jgi:hypothetical protein
MWSLVLITGVLFGCDTVTQTCSFDRDSALHENGGTFATEADCRAAGEKWQEVHLASRTFTCERKGNR